MIRKTIFLSSTAILFFTAAAFSQDHFEEVFEDTDGSAIDLDEVFEGAGSSIFRSFSIQENTNTGLFTSVSIDDEELVLDYEPNRYGVADITVRMSGLFTPTTERTIRVTVLSVNDRPSFTADEISPVPEDGGSWNIQNWAQFNPGPYENNQSPAYEIRNISNTALFSSAPQVNSQGTLSFTAAPDQYGESTFQVIVRDNGGTDRNGVDESFPQTFVITVVPVNDRPDFSASDPPAVNEDAGPIAIENWAGFDPGASNESSQTPTYIITSLNDPNNLLESGPAVNASGTLTYQFGDDAHGSVSFRVVVEDNGGTANGGENRSAEKTFTLTANPVNDPPTFDSDPVVSVDEDTRYEYQIRVSDVDSPNGSLTVAAQTIPEWLDFAEQQNRLSGVPANDHVGVHQVALTVSDGDLSTTQEFEITVRNTNDPPLFVSAPPLRAVVNSRYVYNIEVEDPDVGDELRLTIIEKPDWLTFEDQGGGAGALSGVPSTADMNGDNSVVIRVEDAAEAVASQQFEIEVARVNTPPEIVSEPATTAVQGSEYAYNIEVRDDNENDDVRIEGIDLPDWLELTDNEDKTAVLSGIPGQDDVGTFRIVLLATDEAGASDNQAFDLRVSDVNDAPYFVSDNPPTEATEDEEYVYEVEFGDPDPGDRVTIALEGNHSWLNLETTGDGQARLSGIPDDPAVGAHTIRLTLTDSDGLEAVQEYELTVLNVNDTPVFVTEGIASAQIDTEYFYEIRVEDDDQDAELTILVHEKPAWLTFAVTGANTAQLTGMPPDERDQTYRVRLSATDQHGAQSVQEFDIFINFFPVVSSMSEEIDEDHTFNFSRESFTDLFSDEDGHSLQSVRFPTVPSHGALLLNGAAISEKQDIAANDLDNLAYAPDENYFGVEHFTWQGSDGISYSPEPGRIAIEVAPVNDPPVIVADQDDLDFTPVKDPPLTIAADISITDVDNDHLAGAQVFFNPRTYQKDEDRLIYEAVGNINFAYSEDAGTLVLTGEDTRENYEAALASIRYDNIQDSYTPGTRSVTLYVDDGEASSAFVTRKINIVDGFVELNIPTGFTPNGDGVNDTWLIDDLEQYPDASVFIYDRTGSLVFSARGSGDIWDGRYKGKDLPEGAYFFIIKLNPFNKSIKGSVTIIR